MYTILFEEKGDKSGNGLKAKIISATENGFNSKNATVYKNITDAN